MADRAEPEDREGKAANATATAEPARVFISYASQDAAVAGNLVEALERHGIACWIAPRDVKPGAIYADAIVRAISGAKALVLVLSEHAIASPHVSREIERACSKKHPIFALHIDAAPLIPAFEYFLSESQWIEVQSGHLEAAYARLIEALREPETSVSTIIPPTTTRTSAVKVSTFPPISNRTRTLLAAGLGVLGVASAALWADRMRVMKRAKVEPPGTSVTRVISDKSIAVLPFVDMSEKHDQEYFSDGLSEELIDHLAHIADLKVIARTSSFAFKGKNEDMRSIAATLGVANLLEGSVRKSGNTLRITAQLIRATDGVHLWSEIYDRKLNDIFKVQDEISTTVAKALNTALSATPTVGAQGVSHGTANVEAYNLVLQGNYFYFRGNSGDNTKAIEFLQQALHLDPRYALAWARLARVYVFQGAIGELTAAEAEAKGRDAAERALAIDPNCAEAYYARGNIFRQVVGDWAAAKSDYGRAVALDPHGEIGERAQTAILGLNSLMSGDNRELIDSLRRSLERSPLDTDNMAGLALAQQRAGLLVESAATSDRLLALNPAYATAQAQYGVTLLLMGNAPAAFAAVETESDEASKLEVLAVVHWALGHRAESDSAVSALERGFAHRNAYEIAAAHAYRGEADAAFAWLDRAYQQNKGSLRGVKLDSLFSKLHNDPRFDALLRKAKLLE
jgi:TolB-like protein